MKITVEDLVKKLECSQEFMDKVTSGFMERNERIFYRQPPVHTNGQMEYSELTDNTLASYLEKMPKNVIQKLPTFTADSHTRDKTEDLVHEYIGKKIIMRSGSSKGYSLLQKHWIAMRAAGTFGACAAYLPFLRDHGEYTVGFDPIYWGDLYPEAWSSNINSAEFVQFRDLKTRAALERIKDGLSDEEGQGTWSKAGLQTVLDYGAGQTIGKNNANTKALMQGLPDNMYELFVYCDRDWVITWHYASQTILRKVPNLSHRPRVVALYSDYDGSSIMGRSMVDMAYGAQQAITSLLRNFIYTSDYNTDPAKFVKGINLDEDRFNLEKGNTMFLNDEDGEVKMLPVDTTTIQNFPALYNLMKTVLLTSLPSSSDSSISAGSGDPTYSKTQAGVNDQNSKAEVDNNYYRKNYEQFFEMVLEAQINIYVAEVQAIADKNNAVPMLTLDEEYANLVREINPNVVDEQNRVRIDWSEANPINISVDFESTRDMAKEEDLKRLQEAIGSVMDMAKTDETSTRMLTAVVPALMEKMLEATNLDNSAEIVEDMRAALQEAQAEKQQAQQQEQENQEADRAMSNAKAPTVNISFKDLPPAGKIQAAALYGIELTDEDLLPLMEGEEEQEAVEGEVMPAQEQMRTQPGGVMYEQ